MIRSSLAALFFLFTTSRVFAIPSPVSAVLLDKEFGKVVAENVQDAAQQGLALVLTDYQQVDSWVYFRVAQQIAADLGSELVERGYIVASTRRDDAGRDVVLSLYFSAKPVGAKTKATAIPREVSMVLLNPMYAQRVAEVVALYANGKTSLRIGDISIGQGTRDNDFVSVTLFDDTHTKAGVIVGSVVKSNLGELLVDGVFFSPEGAEPPAGGIRNGSQR